MPAVDAYQVEVPAAKLRVGEATFVLAEVFRVLCCRIEMLAHTAGHALEVVVRYGFEGGVSPQ